MPRTYGDGVRKVIYRDPDGNEIGFRGAIGQFGGVAGGPGGKTIVNSSTHRPGFLARYLSYLPVPSRAGCRATRAGPHIATLGDTLWWAATRTTRLATATPFPVTGTGQLAVASVGAGRDLADRPDNRDHRRLVRRASRDVNCAEEATGRPRTMSKLITQTGPRESASRLLVRGRSTADVRGRSAAQVSVATFSRAAPPRPGKPDHGRRAAPAGTYSGWRSSPRAVRPRHSGAVSSGATDVERRCKERRGSAPASRTVTGPGH